MEHEATRDEAIKKLGELMKDIDFAMLTTVEQDGSLRSRPMSTQQVEFDGDLWFFVGASSPKSQEVQRDPRVNVSYAQPDKQRYVSVSGRGELVRDKQKMQDFWNPVYKIWFKDGLDDPDLALLKVHVEQAEYWDSPSSKFVRLVGFAKAFVTGDDSSLGDNEKIALA